MSALKLKLKGQNSHSEKRTFENKKERESTFNSNIEKAIDESLGTKESVLRASDISYEKKDFENKEKPLNKDGPNSEGKKSSLNLKIVESQKEERRGSSRRKGNRYFYRVANHHELFKIGRSFYTDYMAGVKSFAITSTGYQTSQQKTILGLASFFDHKEDLKIGIISDNLTTGAFKDIVGLSKKVKYDHFGEDQAIDLYSFYNHFEFIDMKQLLDLSNNPDFGDYDETLDHFVDLYDIVFWDVPELHKIQVDSEVYFPVIMKFESISIIVAQSLTKKGDVEDIKNFFLGYGINLKGLLLEEKSSVEKTAEEPISNKKSSNKANSSWWGRLFSK